MQNRVNQPLSEADRNEVKDLITKVESKLRPVCTIMTANEQHELPKPRRNFDNLLPLLISIIEENHLDMPETPMADLQKDLIVQEQMHAFMLSLENLHIMAQDTYRLARAEIWDAFLNYYGVLKAMADFMANGPRRTNAKAKASKED